MFSDVAASNLTVLPLSYHICAYCSGSCSLLPKSIQFVIMQHLIRQIMSNMIVANSQTLDATVIPTFEAYLTYMHKTQC